MENPRRPRQKRPPAPAPTATGLLIPRLHASIPREFGGEHAAVAELMKLGALKEGDTAESLHDLLDLGIGRAINWDDPPFNCLVGQRIKDEPVSFGFTCWPGDIRLMLGDLIQYVTEMTDLLTGISVGRYVTGILNGHPFIGGPDRWDIVEDYHSENLEESDCSKSPLKQNHINPDQEFRDDPEAHAVIAKLLPEVADALDALKVAVPLYDQLLNDYTEFNGAGFEFYAMTGWSHERCHLDHCLDANDEAIRESGECYETIACTLAARDLRGLHEVCVQLHVIGKLGELLWNLKPKETALFLKRLCSVTPDTPGQLLLSTASATA